MMQNRPSTYTIESAKIQGDGDLEIIVTPVTTPWVRMLIWGLVLGVPATLIFVFAAQTGFMFGLILLASAAILPATKPFTIKLRFDFLSRQATFNSFYLLKWPQHIELIVPFSQIRHFGFNLINRSTINVETADGTKFLLQFGVRDYEGKKLVEKFASLGNDATVSIPSTPEAVKMANISDTQSLMQRETQSWFIWLLILGLLQMFAAQGFSSWGALLIAIALASLYFREPAIFVVYAVTIAWAGVSNLLSGATGWNFFAFLQFFFTYRVFTQFRRFQKAEQEARSAFADEMSQLPSRAERIFPWVSIVLGISSMFGYVLMWAAIVTTALLGMGVTSETNPLALGIISTLETLTTYGGLLALATGLAGWLTGFSRKWVSIVGTITGGLTLIVSVIVSLGLEVLSR